MKNLFFITLIMMMTSCLFNQQAHSQIIYTSSANMILSSGNCSSKSVKSQVSCGAPDWYVVLRVQSYCGGSCSCYIGSPLTVYWYANNVTGNFIANVVNSGTYRVQATFYVRENSGQSYRYNSTNYSSQSTVNIYYAAAANFNINGMGASCTANSVYNCNPISMNHTTSGTTTGSNFMYRIFIYNSSSSCTQGTAVYSNGSNPVSSNPAYTNGTFSTLDLNNLPGFQGNWLSTHTGYFLVKLEVKNDCNSGTSIKTGLVNVNSNPDQVSASWAIVPACSGGAYTSPSSSCNSATSQGTFGIGIYASGSGNSISSYTIAVEEWNCTSNSAVPGGLSCTNTFPFNGSFTNISHPLNGFVQSYCGKPAGWFTQANEFAKKYRIKVYVSNACGKSPDVIGFLTNNVVCKESNVQESVAETIDVVSYPNPASDDLTVSLNILQGQEVEINILNLLGQKLSSVSLGSLEPGHQQLNLDISSLENGIYVLEVSGIKQSVIKFVKQ